MKNNDYYNLIIEHLEKKYDDFIVDKIEEYEDYNNIKRFYVTLDLEFLGQTLVLNIHVNKETKEVFIY